MTHGTMTERATNLSCWHLLFGRGVNVALQEIAQTRNKPKAASRIIPSLVAEKSTRWNPYSALTSFQTLPVLPVTWLLPLVIT